MADDRAATPKTSNQLRPLPSLAQPAIAAIRSCLGILGFVLVFLCQ
jgi:hypothetical protein